MKFKMLLLCSLALAACGGEESADDRTEETLSFDNFKADSPLPAGPRDTVFGDADDEGALLELVVTDVWGRLPDRKGTLKLVHETGREITLEGYLQPIMLRLSRPGTYQLRPRSPTTTARR